MFKPCDTAADAPPQFWVETKHLPKATASTFYRKRDETLGEIGFTDGVREICKPAYADASRGGLPGIDPAVYFKMLMIGFSKTFRANVPSQAAAPTPFPCTPFSAINSIRTPRPLQPVCRPKPPRRGNLSSRPRTRPQGPAQARAAQRATSASTPA